MAEADEIRELREALKETKRALDGLLVSRANGNVSTITVNAGGLGVVVTIAAAAVMLTCNLFLAGILVYKLNDYDRRIESANDYAQAAYRGAAYQRGKDDEQANHSGPDSTPATPATGTPEE